MKITPYRLLIISLAFVYIAFGVPKVLGGSSVAPLMQAAFPFFNSTIIALIGIAEIILGVLLLYKKTRSIAAVGIILHLLGTISTYLFNFSYFFNSYTVFTLEGEFVFKNIVYIALAIYILSVENKNLSFSKFLNKSN